MQGLFESLSRRRTGTLGALALVACLLAVVPGGPAHAQSASELEELRDNVLELFDVVPLRTGALLEPLSGGVEVRAIEVSRGEVALDGEVVDEDQLFDRIGSPEANLVLRLSELEEPSIRELLSDDWSDNWVVQVEADLEEDAIDDIADEAEELLEEMEEPEEPKAPTDRREARRERHRRDSQVVVGDTLVVEADEIVEGVTVFGDDAEIYGEVLGDVVSIGGSVTVEGEVGGDVSSVGGSVYLGEEAKVDGDAVSVGGSVHRESGSRVRGEIVEVPFAPSFRMGDWKKFGDWDGDWGHDFEFSPFGMVTQVAWSFFGFILLALLVCLVILLARTPMERIARRVSVEPWKAGLIGLVAQLLFIPLLVLVVVILAVSIIGIPLLLLVPFAVLALVIVGFLGFAAVAYRVGGLLEERFGWNLDNPFLMAVVGVAVIQAISMVGDALDFGWGPVWFFGAMFAVFGALVEYVAWTVGFGGALMTRFGTAEGWGRDGGGDRYAVPNTGTFGAEAELNGAGLDSPDFGSADLDSTDLGIDPDTFDVDGPEVPEIPDESPPAAEEQGDDKPKDA